MKELKLYKVEFAYEIYQEERLNPFEITKTTKMAFASEIIAETNPAQAVKQWEKKMKKHGKKAYLQKITLYAIENDNK